MKTTNDFDQFNALRFKARERRDKAIVAAKAEYAAVLAKIATLEHDLLGGRLKRHSTISDCVQAVMPRDETFTVLEIVAKLEGLEPGRVWRRHSVGNYIVTLMKRGLVRRLDRHKGHEPSVYIRAGANVPKRPFEGQSLAVVMRQVLTKPMSQTELAIRILEAGYHTTMSKKAFRKQVGEMLAMPGNGFVKDGAKWEWAGPCRSPDHVPTQMAHS